MKSLQPSPCSCTGTGRDGGPCSRAPWIVVEEVPPTRICTGDILFKILLCVRSGVALHYLALHVRRMQIPHGVSCMLAIPNTPVQCISFI